MSHMHTPHTEQVKRRFRAKAPRVEASTTCRASSPVERRSTTSPPHSYDSSGFMQQKIENIRRKSIPKSALLPHSMKCNNAPLHVSKQRQLRDEQPNRRRKKASKR